MANEQYARSLGQQLATMQRSIARMSAGERTQSLGFSSIEDSYIRAYDVLGQAKMLLGKQSDGNYAITYQNGTPPPQTTAPLVTAHQLSLSIGWDGEFLDGDGNRIARPSDVVRVDVHVAETENFTPDGTTVIGSLPAEGAVSVFADSDPHYVRLVAVTNADVPGPPSDEIAVIPLPADQIAVGAIGAEQLAADVVLSSRIIVGDPTMAHTEIQGGDTVDSGIRSFDANNQITAQWAPNGTFTWYDDETHTRSVEINSEGFMTFFDATTDKVVLQFSNGALNGWNWQNGAYDKTFALSSAGLNMKGTLRTADSGSRIEIKPGVGITFYANSTEAGSWTNWQQNTFNDSNDGGKSKAGFRIIGPTVGHPGGYKYFMDQMSGGMSTEYFSVRVRRSDTSNEYARIILRPNNIEMVSGPFTHQAHYPQSNWAAQLFLPWGGASVNGSGAQPITMLQEEKWGGTNINRSGFQGAVEPQYAALIYSTGGLMLRNYSNTAYTTFTCGDLYAGKITYNSLVQNSGMEFKEEIEPLPASALNVVRSAPISRWRYRNEQGDKHIGPMADDLPEWLTVESVDVDVEEVEVGVFNASANMTRVRPVENRRTSSAIDIASQVGLLWAALRELDEELDALRDRATIDKPKRQYSHRRRTLEA